LLPELSFRLMADLALIREYERRGRFLPAFAGK
jgi:hypothetical protein